MRKIILGMAFFTSLTGFSKESKSVDWTGLTRERIELGLPFLVIKGSKGFAACGYLNAETCNKTGEACVVISGVKTHEDMLEKEVKAVSNKAAELGIKVGMKGSEAIQLLK